MEKSPFVRLALLQEKVDDKVKCLTCERHCVLREGQKGWCGTRINYRGKLYTLIYGMVSSLSANPIEKKPLYHFYPGSVALTAGSFGCNFDCPWCQNWEISKSAPDPILARFYSPEKFVQEAIRRGCQGTSISFNEPTLSLEWSLEVFRLAREKGLYNTFVTNGYMTPQALELLIEAGLDAMNIDVKGGAEAVRKFCKADVEKVWRNCKAAKETGVHVEVTTLVIPSVNSDEVTLHSIASRIYHELGPDTPWHVTGYYPAYHFNAPPTPVKLLEKARQIGLEEGLEFVYIGNVLGHPGENTYCPNCGHLLIERFGLSVTGCNLRDGKCPRCGREIPIVGG
ncbi:MAG: AmmeMemoRadiSam system radical SAM enzyme [Chloroflexi bacterium]|nr:MAG: AmmeMemoRadiSam system radical SAM enzyme [Chloroflexota bacterium]HDN80625.1 AmmeMemoRadiSam system radical SAM enzyme [Chloroflexota bacterium]